MNISESEGEAPEGAAWKAYLDMKETKETNSGAVALPLLVRAVK